MKPSRKLPLFHVDAIIVVFLAMVIAVTIVLVVAFANEIDEGLTEFFKRLVL